ncbi:hypothetical protein FRZ03_16265 [Streptomyces misionensis]|uniref:Uncharacterized protein n=1 Tax=Streptomyces misionensis TaxID=67331 RepID=A0A5C6JU32_9ACTN|nr:hypothetical protein [Streptomyces misionensis]TWV45538.1 hypothetical protein FRZ03_16265 [Streptomyces misionensis]
MTDHDDRTRDGIATLLADAAEGFETGAAPVAAVVRAGRRRRTRRWAAGAVAAAMLAGGTGTLAATGLPGTAHETASPARSPWTPGHLVYEPVDTTVGYGTQHGVQWAVGLRVWPAPRDRAEAVRQMKAMADWGLTPVTSGSPSDLIGRTSYFVIRSFGTSDRRLVTSDTVARLPTLKGDEIRVFPQPLTDGGSPRLVVGMVAKTARQVTCHWKDGSTTLAERVPDNTAMRPADAVIRSVRDFPTANWFACVSPGSTAYRSAEVTK